MHDIIAGHQLQPPKGIIREETLQRMGTEVIRLCDSMERHGLVDYQMGVWEEEILDCKSHSDLRCVPHRDRVKGLTVCLSYPRVP